MVQYRVFESGLAETSSDHLNALLRQNRVLSIEKQFVDAGFESFFASRVEYDAQRPDIKYDRSEKGPGGGSPGLGIEGARAWKTMIRKMEEEQWRFDRTENKAALVASRNRGKPKLQPRTLQGTPGWLAKALRDPSPLRPGLTP